MLNPSSFLSFKTSQSPAIVFLPPPFPFSFPFPIFSWRFWPLQGRSHGYPTLCGGTKVGIWLLPSQILPFDSLPFSHPSCSIPALPAGGFPWKQPRKFEKRSTKGLLHLNVNEGREAPCSSSLCREETPKFIFNKLLAICKLVSIPLFSRFVGQKLGETSLFINSGGSSGQPLLFSSQLPKLHSGLERFSLKIQHLLHISRSRRTRWYCQLFVEELWIVCPWESAEPVLNLFYIFTFYILHFNPHSAAETQRWNCRDNEMIKFDLGFQVCCLLSIMKKKKRKGKETKISWDDNILSANVLNYKVWYKCFKGQGSHFACRFFSVAFSMTDSPILPEKIFQEKGIIWESVLQILWLKHQPCRALRHFLSFFFANSSHEKPAWLSWWIWKGLIKENSR